MGYLAAKGMARGYPLSPSPSTLPSSPSLPAFLSPPTPALALPPWQISSLNCSATEPRASHC
eukprot:3287361-Rhodomonas_salina.2